VDIDYGILGPVQAIREGSPIPLGGPRQRAVLARLLLDPGLVVPVDVLIEDVWSGDPPPTATVTLQKYVSELRKVLGRTEIVTSGRGYAVDADADAVDARRFERLVSEENFDDALALWRGEPLADVPDVLFVVTERGRLEELRLAAVELSLEADVAAGEHLGAAPRLQELVQQYPLRERLCRLFMLALYRSGRQAEALEVYQDHRRRLVDEIGVDPAEELVELQQAILRHDRSLELAPAPSGSADNLRLPVSLFVGREAECDRVLDALGSTRIVTLVGPGGVGKTRLATESAARTLPTYPGGVWVVDLAALTEPELIDRQVATTLGIADQPGQDVAETIATALHHRERLLLLLDNCEHVFDGAAAFVDRSVRAAAQVHVLATSRRPLGVDGEHVVPVAPLSEADACVLFADRALLSGVAREEAVAAGIADICHSMDGLPLALELAASQLRALGPDEVVARLDERLRFVSSRFDALPRQRTLRDMVAWSHGLLPPSAQRAFDRLGVFATTLTLDAAAAVCDGENVVADVTTLVQHSLLIREPGTTEPARFRMLDTLRLYALEQLREGDGEQAVRRAHAEFYLALAQESGSHIYGPDESAWADRLEREEPNLHAAMSWAVGRDSELALRIGIALRPYWDLKWRERDAIAYFTSILDSPLQPIPDGLRAGALAAMADLVANPGEARRATTWATEAVGQFRALGDDAGLAFALLALSSALANAGSLERANAVLDEAVALGREVDNAALVARGFDLRSFMARRRGDHRDAERLSRGELAAWSALGSRRRQAGALRHIAVALQEDGELDGASEFADQALARWREIGDVAAIAHVRSTLADIARQRGDTGTALGLYDDAIDVFRKIGDRRCTASTYKNLGAIAGVRGEHERATALFVDAVRLRYELGDYVGLAECFDGLAESLAAEGRSADATRMRAAAGQSAGTMVPAQRGGRTQLSSRSSIDEAVKFALAMSRSPGPTTAGT
jgi:predicted ATPase/DNA-binding SARP family transcriptional activator